MVCKNKPIEVGHPSPEIGIIFPTIFCVITYACGEATMKNTKAE
jgi:hypothetical protein